jgi:UDP-N-acetylmuramate--alanine ligase
MYNQAQHLHFIGIGGVGMAGIAEVLLNLGYSISGTDLKRSDLTDHLVELGAIVAFGHKAENLPLQTSVVVVSSAVPGENPELVAAAERGIPVIPRAEMLAELMRMKYGVVVAGSHGKTTTTTMVAKVLSDAGLDPTLIVGGKVLSQSSGASVGTGQYLVAESDESDGSFCMLKPAIAVVTNIDREHLNHYGSIGALEDAFRQFMASVPFYGLVVACHDDPVVRSMAAGLKRRAVTYGFSPGAAVSADAVETVRGGATYRLLLQGKPSGKVSLPIPGRHMVSNSLAAIAVGLELGVYHEEIIESLGRFPGVARRTQVLFDSSKEFRRSEAEAIVVIDDYAHHPTEIAATLAAIRKGWIESSSKPGRLIAVFEPHRYTRFQDLFTQFLNVFSDADELIVGEIYPAGESPIPGLSSKQLVDSLGRTSARYIQSLPAAIEQIAEELKPGDVLVTLGAGPVTATGHKIAAYMRGKGG